MKSWTLNALDMFIYLYHRDPFLSLDLKFDIICALINELKHLSLYLMETWILQLYIILFQLLFFQHHWARVLCQCLEGEGAIIAQTIIPFTVTHLEESEASDPSRPPRRAISGAKQQVASHPAAVCHIPAQHHPTRVAPAVAAAVAVAEGSLQWCPRPPHSSFPRLLPLPQPLISSRRRLPRRLSTPSLHPHSMAALLTPHSTTNPLVSSFASKLLKT